MKCENCGCDHDGSYGSGRFCSAKCARSFSSKSLQNQGIKIVRCKNCGKEFNVHKHDQNIKMCPDCVKKHARKKICKICGSEQCNNHFCKTHSTKFLNRIFTIFDIDTSFIGTPKVFEGLDNIKNLLKNLYWGSELSSIEIANIFNCKTHIITDLLYFFGIDLRNSQDALLNAVIRNRWKLPKTQYFFKDEYHKTWDGRIVYLRSSYETDFANKLDDKQIFYEVESLKIKYFDRSINKYRIAVPDFYVPETNTIFEIKSIYTYNEENMKDKFDEYKKLGYNCVLVLDHQEIVI